MKGAQIGHNAVLTTTNHGLELENGRRNHCGPIKIGAHVRIGSNAALLSGVSIGNRAVVAAGAVVTRNVPAGTVVGGISAKAVKTISAKTD